MTKMTMRKMPEISCTKVQNYVDAVATPEWTPEWRDRIALHVTECEECRFAAAGAELLDASLRSSAEPAPPVRMAAIILERTKEIAEARRLEQPSEAGDRRLPAASMAWMGIWRPIAWGALGLAVVVISGGGVDGLMTAELDRVLDPFAGRASDAMPLWITNAMPMWMTEATPAWSGVAVVAAGILLLSAAFGSPREE
jgi:hypothetical protein